MTDPTTPKEHFEIEAESWPICADEKNPALSVGRKHLGTSKRASHPARRVPAVVFMVLAARPTLAEVTLADRSFPGLPAEYCDGHTEYHGVACRDAFPRDILVWCDHHS